MLIMRNLFFSLMLVGSFLHAAGVRTGLDCFFDGKYKAELVGKKVGIVTNHTAINGSGEHIIDLFKRHETEGKYKLAALFAPEHGINGLVHAGKHVGDSTGKYNIPIHSLHGETRRPTAKMLKGLDVLVYDIQDIGSRSYTYISTLFYVMEEAVKKKIRVIVLDRPNPINGVVVDGPMLEKSWRSFVGYINVPYCHGMTVGELARFFNSEYKVKCDLVVVPMQGWTRNMSFADTSLMWVPTSPNIPTMNSPRYYPTTGTLGELQLTSIGIGCNLPFEIVVAPWILAEDFAKALNKQKFSGVTFLPFHFTPFYGKFKGKSCQGVQIVVTDVLKFKPIEVQFLIFGILKSLYPVQFAAAIERSKGRKTMFCKVTGTSQIYDMLKKEKYIVWKLKNFHKEEREAFLSIRQNHLLY